MLNKLRFRANFQFSTNQITWSRLLKWILILNDKQCRSRSVGFFRSKLIWIYTVCKDRVYPASAGQGLKITRVNCNWPLICFFCDQMFAFLCIVYLGPNIPSIIRSESIHLMEQHSKYYAVCDFLCRKKKKISQNTVLWENSEWRKMGKHALWNSTIIQDGRITIYLQTLMWFWRWWPRWEK